MAISNEYIMACIGGIIIAISSSLNLLLKGRITGISGIFFGIITFNDIIWRFAFLLGMLFSTIFFNNFIDNTNLKDTHTNFIKDLNFFGFIVGGFLVGYGTKWANGCTSGHGVCGIPRLSRRSIVACIVFCSVGMFTATFRHRFPFLSGADFLDVSKHLDSKQFQFITFCVIIAAILSLFLYILINRLFESLYDYFVSLGCGVLFGAGLIISGMNRKTKVINFLDVFSKHWDPSLLFVLMSAVTVNLILFNLIIRVKKTPVFAEKLSIPEKTDLDLGIVLGSSIFGIGWGMSGLCPGPALVNTFNYIPHVPVFLLSMGVGQYSAYKINSLLNL
jgi:uncharacterized membrane protein YedE/YeeE